MEKKTKRRRRASGKAPRTELPDDVIVTQLLPRLPVKSLFRFTSVCRRWKSLISSTQFVKSHLHFSSSNFGHYLCRAYYKWYSLAYEGLSSLQPVVPLHDGNFLDTSLDEKLIGCCNGLVCLLSMGSRCKKFALWNPATHEFWSTAFPDHATNHSWFCGFCYVPGLDDYVIFVWVQKPLIFSWRTGEWSEIEAKAPVGIDLGRVRDPPVGVSLGDDTLYWYISDKSCVPYRNLIIGFNLMTREFETIPIPGWMLEYLGARLYVLQGCLSFYCYHKGTTKRYSDVWMMKQQGNPDSWMKAFSLPYGIVRSMDLSIPSKCTIIYDRDLKLVDLTQTSLAPRLQGTQIKAYVVDFTCYFPSLVSPFGANPTFPGELEDF